MIIMILMIIVIIMIIILIKIIIVKVQMIALWILLSAYIFVTIVDHNLKKERLLIIISSIKYAFYFGEGKGPWDQFFYEFLNVFFCL